MIKCEFCGKSAWVKKQNEIFEEFVRNNGKTCQSVTSEQIRQSINAETRRCGILGANPMTGRTFRDVAVDCARNLLKEKCREQIKWWLSEGKQVQVKVKTAMIGEPEWFDVDLTNSINLAEKAIDARVKSNDITALVTIPKPAKFWCATESWVAMGLHIERLVPHEYERNQKWLDAGLVFKTREEANQYLWKLRCTRTQINYAQPDSEML